MKIPDSLYATAVASAAAVVSAFLVTRCARDVSREQAQAARYAADAARYATFRDGDAMCILDRRDGRAMEIRPHSSAEPYPYSFEPFDEAYGSAKSIERMVFEELRKEAKGKEPSLPRRR